MPNRKDYNYLKKQFFDPDSKYKLSVYFDAKQTDAASDAVNFLVSCEKNDVGYIIPRISEDRRLDEGELEHFRNTYRAMLEAAKAKGIHLAFNIEGAIEDALVSVEEDIYGESEMRSKVLVKREYYCSEEEEVNMNLRGGSRMSLVAVNDRSYEIIDLRPFVENSILKWTAPKGNWIINEFLCVEEENANYANVLSYDASRKCLNAAYSLFEDIFSEYVPDVLSVLSYNNVCFSGTNRRDWDPEFNRVFEERYGFDPSPYYPALFSSNIPNSAHYKALFFDCRARMLCSGMIKALHDFADEKGLRLIGSVTEPKLSACSFINGDALLDGMYAPGAMLDKAYMYGTNSVKLAAAASYNFGEETVSCDLFRDYYKISKRIMYNDTLNAYARGANMMLAHMPFIESEENNPVPFVKSETAPHWQSEFACFTSRTQALLRGGTHVSDIGVLYPIYTIHSSVNFYCAEVERFEYPETPDNLDYMTLINSITMYAGHDLTILHPDTVSERCTVKDGCLYMTNGHRTECLRVIVLPCSETVSLANMRVLLEFYRSGGRLVATGALPERAFEFSEDGSNDREVREIAKEIFGDDASNPQIMKDYCYNSNENGGEAYFLYFSRTAADGTNMTTSRNITKALCAFDIPYDMFLPDMPRLEGTGALNTPYFEFVRLGLIYSIPGGGMLNHIHKRHGNTDVYYFSNTTERNYDNFVLLRGAISPEEWDPHSVTVKDLPYKYVSYKGEIYTRVELKIRHCASVFIISDTDVNPPRIPESIPKIDTPCGLE